MMGLVPDLWRPFEEYARADGELPSTFFVIPFRGRPGIAPDNSTNDDRAVAYQMSDVRDELREAVASGREVAVHGIDAWRDTDAGRQEMAELAAVTGQLRSGVRMHWLYFTVSRHSDWSGRDSTMTPPSAITTRLAIRPYPPGVSVAGCPRWLELP